MDGPQCPGCIERDARIAELERRLSALEARLKTNSSNSSTPPSANPLGAKPPVTKKKKKKNRRRGGQTGHPAHLKQLLPADQVTRTKVFVPDSCSGCEAPLPREAGPNDPEPKRCWVHRLRWAQWQTWNKKSVPRWSRLTKKPWKRCVERR